MSDDIFRLTPLDVRKQEFKKTMRGYDPLQVEDFRGRAADELERAGRGRARARRGRGRLEQGGQQLGQKHHAYLTALRSLVERQKAELDALAETEPAPFGKVAGTIAPAEQQAQAGGGGDRRKTSPKWIKSIVEE